MSIVITGAAGFIASGTVAYFNENYPGKKIIAVDDFSNEIKNKNLKNKNVHEYVNRESFIEKDGFDFRDTELIIHLGARTDTAETDESIFNRLNLEYSKKVWQICTENSIPLIYASSAATYGAGEYGYKDDHDIVPHLKPLNPYGKSKNEFDKWALSQKTQPPRWYGLKFFNVFGPNEYHKGRMASVVFHAYNQIQETGKMRLFRSHNPRYADGQQMRDFIYVKDIFKVIDFLYKNQSKVESGLYNLGTGKARTFLDLAASVFYALNKTPKIEFIDTPEDIREKYQYYTKAEMDKLRRAGYLAPFYSLEKGIIEYVREYLSKGEHL